MAGGVAVGTAGEMMLTPFGSMIVGFLAGVISTLGFKYLSVRSHWCVWCMQGHRDGVKCLQGHRDGLKCIQGHRDGV